MKPIISNGSGKVLQASLFNSCLPRGPPEPWLLLCRLPYNAITSSSGISIKLEPVHQLICWGWSGLNSRKTDAQPVLLCRQWQWRSMHISSGLHLRHGEGKQSKQLKNPRPLKWLNRLLAWRRSELLSQLLPNLPLALPQSPLGHRVIICTASRSHPMPSLCCAP